MKLRGPRGMLNLARPRRRRDGEPGQILVLFALVIVLLMVLASVVIDVGLFRTDGARLQNALDAAALAAAQKLPANATNVADARTTAESFTQQNFPGIATPGTSFICLVGVDSNGNPRVADMPGVCNVSFAANDSRWRCTGLVCWAPCDPVAIATDVCNTIIVSDNATRQYSFGRAVGITQANTGTKVAAACVGPCGAPAIVPVDVVVILDRTGSMDSSGSVANLRDGGKAVLSAFNPDLQRVALGFTGPTSLWNTTNGSYGGAASSQPLATCTNPNTVHALSLDPGSTMPGPVPTLVGTPTSATNTSTPPSSNNGVDIPKPAGTANGDFMLATIVVDGGSSTSITPPAGWTLIRRTNNSTYIGVATFYRFAGTSEGASYVFRVTSSIRAVGGIVRYTGVNTSTPIDVSGPTTNPTNASSTNLTAAAISTTTTNTALVAAYGSDTRTSFSTMSGGLGERIDRQHPNAAGPTVGVGTGSQASTGTTGSKGATTANAARWVAQLIALKGIPGPADVYGTDVNADVDQWVPIGFSGTDTDAPALGTNGTYNEAYATGTPPNAVPVSSSHIVQAINCFDVSSTGTNLARPLYMATRYLADHGRPGVKQGIILETDGAPNDTTGDTSTGPGTDYTSTGVLAAATAAKNAGIEIFTIGYGDATNDVNLRNLLANMATGPNIGSNGCGATENGDGDHFFCQPDGADLADVLRAAAVQLVGGSKLVQLYPQPIVQSVSPSGGAKAGGTSVTITGKYFDETYSVTFGGTPAQSFSVLSDTTIQAVSPAGTANATVDIRVSTPGGSSKITGVDQFTYGP